MIEPPHLAPLRETLRRFVEREMPREAVRRWDRERTFPMETFRRLAEAVPGPRVFRARY